MSRGRVALIAGGLLVAAILLSQLGSGGSADPKERPGASSESDGQAGLSILRDLLARAGHDVGALNETPSRASLDPGSTVILLDSGPIASEETAALGAFVRDGGRLVFGGDTSLTAYSELLGAEINHDNAGPREATPFVPSPETVDVARIELLGAGSFADTGPALPAAGDARGTAVMATARIGRGTLILLADPSPLQNAYIGEADNAQLGLDLAGDPGRPVRFAEQVRLSASSGLGALPTRWRLAFAGLVGAGLVLIASRFRRTGPPELPSRPLAPPRRRYVDAVATALARTGDPAAADPVRIAARRRLLAGSAEGMDAGRDEIASLAAAAGLEPEEWEALTAPPADEQQMLAAGSALAKLKEAGR